MEIANLSLDEFTMTIDVVMVSNDREIGFIRLTPRWRKIASLLKDAVKEGSERPLEMFEIMTAEVVDHFLNEYCQRTVLYRLKYGKIK